MVSDTIPSAIPSSIKLENIDGLNHVDVALDSKSHTSPAFVSQLLSIVAAFRVPGWYESNLSPTSVLVHKTSGSLTNTVFFVSSQSPSAPTYLLRIYGSSSSSLISRSHELHIAYVLSSRYQVAPQIFGTFINGRVEEYLDSSALMPSDLRDKSISLWIAARMAELHSIPLTDIAGPSIVSDQEGKSWEIGVKQNVKAWYPIARKVAIHPNMSKDDRAALDMDMFDEYWTRYMEWLSRTEKEEGITPRVFSHNDLHCKNILRMNGGVPVGTPEYRQIVIVDYEYAAPNPLAFDIANHFQEWTCDFFSPSVRVLDYSLYPSREDRYNFYRAYLTRAASLASSTEPVISDDSLDRLERQVRMWSPAVHGMWTVEGTTQCKKNLEQGEDTDFDFIYYAKARMEAFIREVKGLGVDVPETLVP